MFMGFRLNCLQFNSAGGQRLPLSFRPYALRRLTARLLGFRGVHTVKKHERQPP